MIFITQLIYLHDGQEDVFHQFESLAIPIISRYRGKLLLRIRPGDESLIESRIDKPYEIHLVQFESEKDFESFCQDDERRQFLHLKAQSIRAVLLIKGTAI